MAKVIVYELRINGQDVVIRNQKELRDAIRQTNKALDGADIGSKRYKELQGVLGGLKKIQRDVRADTRQSERAFTRAADAGQNSYRALNAELVDLRKEFRELGQEAREGIAGRRLRSRIQQLDKELKAIDASLGQNFRSIGNYKTAFSGLANTLKKGLLAAGVTVGVDALRQSVVASVTTFADFKDQIALLGAVSGASAEDLETLEGEAERLGATTQFTASQVAELQTNFARAGFDTNQIVEATEATLNLAAATGEDLARSSEVVAATLGGYGLSAEETARVTDVMAASFNTSRLQLDSFFESTKLVAPAASSLGISIEQTTGALGALADAGLEGSIAGTGLRRILADLGNENSKLSKTLGVTVTDAESFNEAIAKIGELGPDITKSTELVGRNASTALTKLGQSAPQILQLGAGLADVTDQTEALGLTTGELEEFGIALDDIPDKYRDIAGAAETAAKTQDSIQGDFRGFQSALEGLQIRIVGLFEDELRAAVDFGSRALGTIGDVLEFLFRTFQPVIKAVGELFGELAEGNDVTGQAGRLFEFFGGAIVLVANVLASAIRITTGWIRATKEVIANNETLSAAFAIIKNAVFDFQEILSNLPAFLNGVVTAYSQFVSNIQNRDFSVGIGESFRKGFNDAKTFTQKGQEDVLTQIEESNRIIGLAGAESSEEAGKKVVGGIVTGLQDGEDDVEDAGRDLGKSANKGVKDGLEDNVVAGSIKFLKNEISALKKEIEESGDGNVIRDKIEDLVAKERELEALEERIAKIREEFAKEDGLLAFDVASFEEAKARAEELQRLAEDGYGDEIQRQIEEATEAELEAIEIRKLRAIEALRERGLTEEEFAARRVEIEREAELEAIRTRRALAEVGSSEYLALKQEEADIEAAIEAEKAERIKEIRDNLREQLIEGALSTAQQIADSVFEIRAQRIEEEASREAEAAQERADQRLRFVEEGSLEEQRINEELEAANLAIAANAARERKKLAIKQAIINTALAIGNALATVQPFIPAAILAAGLAAVRGGIEVATISAQQFAKGGEISGPSHSRGGVKGVVRSTGQRVELEGGEGVLNKRTMAMRRRVSLSGTPREIASALNVMGGGVRFTGARVASVFQDGGVIPPSLPVTGSQGGGQMVNVNISEEGILQIAEAVRVGAEIGSEEGSARAVEESRRIREREASLQRRTNI